MSEEGIWLCFVAAGMVCLIALATIVVFNLPWLQKEKEVAGDRVVHIPQYCHVCKHAFEPSSMFSVKVEEHDRGYRGNVTERIQDYCTEHRPKFDLIRTNNYGQSITYWKYQVHEVEVLDDGTLRYPPLLVYKREEPPKRVIAHLKKESV